MSPDSPRHYVEHPILRYKLGTNIFIGLRLWWDCCERWQHVGGSASKLTCYRLLYSHRIFMLLFFNFYLVFVLRVCPIVHLSLYNLFRIKQRSFQNASHTYIILQNQRALKRAQTSAKVKIPRDIFSRGNIIVSWFKTWLKHAAGSSRMVPLDRIHTTSY